MRLKSLLHCVQCHLVLLILVGFLVAGYLLRDELGTLVGWSGTTRPPPAAAPERQGLPAEWPAASGAEAPGPALATEGRRDPSTDRSDVSPSEPGTAEQDAFAVRAPLTQGEFRFRPMDESMSTDRPEIDVERRSEMLAAARRAYWSRDIPLAIRHYKALTQAYPNDPDFYGEMGNIYYEQGEYELAGQAYYEAGLLLLGRGEHTRARELADLLQETAPGYAEGLLERLQGTH